jgi:hypothetical protein
MRKARSRGKTGIRRLINAFGYSLDGIKAAFRHEDAFRQLALLAIILIPLPCSSYRPARWPCTAGGQFTGNPHHRTA